MIPTPQQPVERTQPAPSPVPSASRPQPTNTSGALQPIVTAGLLVPKQDGLPAASGKKSQRTAIRHESKHMHAGATKLPQK